MLLQAISALVPEFYTVEHICNSSVVARMSTMNPTHNEQHCRNQKRSQTPSCITIGENVVPSAMQYPASCRGALLQFYTQKVEDMKMGEPLHSEIQGIFPSYWRAQEERTLGSAELPFKQTGLVSLPCRLLWLVSNHQNLKCNRSSGICLQVIPASRPYPPTRSHACLRLQTNPFVFT